MDQPLCEFCRAQRGIVYCKSDSACLCLSCDGYVHSANALSRRHLRTLICDRCHSQPAVLRCLDDKITLCQICDLNAPNCSGHHQRQSMNCYSGCPSPSELSSIWSCVLDIPTPIEEAGPGCGGSGIMTMNENCVSTSWELRENVSSVGVPMAGALTGLEPCAARSEPWIGTSSSFSMVPELDPDMSCGGEPQGFLNKEPNLPKLGCPLFKDLGVCDDAELCGSFSTVDAGFNFLNNDEIFGCPQTHPRYPFQDGGIDGLFMENFSVADSNGHIENAVEASSSGQDYMTRQSSRIVGPAGAVQAMNSNADQVFLNINGNRNVSLCFSTPNICPNISLSLSNLTGESSAADYQDCGVSPMFGTGESPWDSSLETSRPQARNEAKMRYNEKKKSRSFGKQIRYASRKARADTRKRVKGRFVKAGEAYDYDPLKVRSS